jgi:hypothetical protein
MTELSFLLDLLLNHKLPKATREAVTQRIKDVETRLSSAAPSFRVSAAPAPVPFQLPPGAPPQSPSTLAAMARHAANDAGIPMQRQDIAVVQDTPGLAVLGTEPTQPAVVAQTPAAMAAMLQRNEVIARAASGKPEPGRTSPRKF